MRPVPAARLPSSSDGIHVETTENFVLHKRASSAVSGVLERRHSYEIAIRSSL